MDLGQANDSEARFASYIDGLARVIGHADRVGPLRDYCTGLMLPGERKSVEQMAARTAPARTAAQHQSLLHFVGVGGWSDEKVLSKVREMVLPGIERHGPIEAWIIDDTAFPKQGRHSVGVARQYCGQLGKQDNCQVAVSLSLANHHASLPVAYRLYLPQDWAEDAARRRKAGVPADVSFETKQEIALKQLQWACGQGLPRGVALMDPGYGHSAQMRAGVTALDLTYVAGIQSNTLVWPTGAGPKRKAKSANKKGRRDEPELILVKEVALGLVKKAWRKIKWREGSADWLTSRFARLRVRVGHRHVVGHHHVIAESVKEEWLLIEWPEDEAEPTKYWLSTLPEDISFRRLVDFAKLRWRIERDYQELKQEVGIGHFEGRGWRGFHHHATLCIAAYGFLISERETIPPSEAGRPTLLSQPAVPQDYKPRGSAHTTRATHPRLHRNNAHTIAHRARAKPAAMPLLQGPAHQSQAVDL
jgi:SRSO17 transposase